VIVDLATREFELFQTLLLEESGLFFEMDRQGLLRSALTDRMTARQIKTPHEYYQLVRNPVDGPGEIKALIDLVTVGETYFFRNQPHFDALRRSILPQLIEQRLSGSRSITIWSAACSTGEEPYSLAMLLLETLPHAESWNISLLATDVNREHLRRAREAVYGARAVRNVPPAWLEKYFEQRDGSHFLREQVKRLVRFGHHNLVRDPYSLPGMQHVDLVFCRNVTIYFTLDVTRRVMGHFAECLADGGCLFIGDAETLWQVSDKFAPVEFPHTFIYQHATRRMQQAATLLVNLPEPAVISAPQPAPRAGLSATSGPPPGVESSPLVTAHAGKSASMAKFSCKRGKAALRAKDYDEALTQFNGVLCEDPFNIEAYVGKASILADRDQHDEAIAQLQQVIRYDNLSCEAYYLLGVLYAKKGDLPNAVASFEQAVYVDHTLALVYFSLANIFRSQGRGDKACRQFLNALQAVEGRPNDELVRFSDDITCEYLRTACQRCLEQAGAARTSEPRRFSSKQVVHQNR